MERIDGGKITKRKSKIVARKGHKKGKSSHHHHHHDHEEEHHHHHEDEHHHHHDSDEHMPCEGTMLAFELEKVGQFYFEVSKDEIHRMIFKGI